MNPVPPGLGPDVEDGVPRSLRAGAEDTRLADQSHGHGVDDRVAGVLGGEADLAAQVGNAEAVAVPADARDDTLDEAAAPRVLGGAEAQRVEHGDGPGAHGEDVAQDAAHPRGRALEGLDEGRVIVALDLEREGEVTAQIHDARVLPGALEHGGPRRGQTTQEDARMLVGAVLGPQRAEESELGEGGLPAEAPDDAVVLLAGQA